MGNLKKHFNKNELSKVFTLYSRQPWIMQKEDVFLELIDLCETSENKQLIINLLTEFHFLSGETYKNFLYSIADFIVNDSGFIEENTQIASLTYDDEADSSQSILQSIKIPLYKQGWQSVKTVNRFGDAMKNCNKGRKQIIFVDEFVGSGSTVIGRMEYFNKNVSGQFEIKFCFIAGMEYGLRKIEELGYEVFCPLTLPRAISEVYNSPEREKAIQHMETLESKLAEKINTFDLENYSFGYNKAEALYTLEGELGNTPNSVFPIFWWPQLKNNIKRDTLLTRFEKGLR